MSWYAVGAAAIGLLGSSASSSAAKKQTQAAQQQIAEQRRQYDLTRADQAPFMQTGVAGNERLRQLLGLDAGYGGADAGSLTRRFSDTDLQADPVYQNAMRLGLQEGTAGINARAIAGGGYDSGATLKALTRFGTDYGATKGNEAYNRYITDQGNIYNRLAGVSGAGQTALGQVGAAGQNMMSGVSEALGAAGNARAAGIVGGANAWGNAATQGINAYQNQQQNETLRRLLAAYGGGGGSITPAYDYSFDR